MSRRRMRMPTRVRTDYQFCSLLSIRLIYPYILEEILSKMRFFNARLLVVLALFFQSKSDGHGGDCGTHEVSEKIIANDVSRMQPYQSRANGSVLCQQCIVVQVVFHVITNQAGTSTANTLTDQALAEEIRLLNERFVATPFKFNHRQTTRTVSDAWSSVDTHQNKQIVDTIVPALRVGGPDVVNVFYTDGTCNKFAGFASFPQEYGFYPSDQYTLRDRIFMCSSITGPTETTLAHEFGHWFGLRTYLPLAVLHS